MQLRWQVTFQDDPEEDTRAGEPHPLNWGDDKEPRMEEEDLSVHLLLTPKSRSSLQKDECLGLVMNWSMTLSRPQCLSPPPRGTISGSAGMHSMWKCQHSGKSSKKFPARVMSRNSPGGCGNLFRCQRQDAMLPKWRMISLSCQHPSL